MQCRGRPDEACETLAHLLRVGRLRRQREVTLEVVPGGGRALEPLVEEPAHADGVGGVGHDDEEEVDRLERVRRVVARSVDEA